MSVSPGDAHARLASIVADIQGRDLPPVDQWHPTRSGEIDMRIARDGGWYYRGSRIERDRMVRLFSTVLRRDDDGYWLVTPVEKMRIVVDDAPFIAVAVERLGGTDNPTLVFTTNVGERVVADAQHRVSVRYDEPGGEPSPYVRVRARLDALIARQTFIEMAGFACRRDEHYGVVSNGIFMPLGPANEPT